MPTVFFTGFPGFLGVQLLPRVLARSEDHEAVCLVQPKFLALAQQRREEIEKANPALVGRIRLEAGDITRPDLGLADASAIQADTVEIFHLAAVYDLAVARDLAMRVNVDGTRHVLDFAERCPGLTRLQYVSTCYVSGRHPGIFKETDLAKGQPFNNHYEETKYLAEVEVQRRMDDLPTTIYRPSVVAGDSATGETQKFDGPYYGIRLVLRQPGPVAIVPKMGDPSAIRLNFVPRDFVVDGIAALSARDESLGKVYALADPDPLTWRELWDVMGQAAGKRLVQVRLPREPAKAAVRRVPGLEALLGVPAELMDYLTHPTYYLTTKAEEDLKGSGVLLPDRHEYVHRLVEYVRTHRDTSSAAMV